MLEKLTKLELDGDLILPLVFGVMGVGLSAIMLSELAAERATIDVLEKEQFVTGKVLPQQKTLVTPYLERTGVVAYYAWLEETTTDSDGDSSTSVIETRSDLTPFALDTNKGRVVISGGVGELRYPNNGRGRSKEKGNREWLEKEVRPGDELTVLDPGDVARIRAKKSKKLAITGSVRMYRGRPGRWLKEMRDAAGWSILGGGIGWLVGAGALGIIVLALLRTIRLKLVPALAEAEDREVEEEVGAILTALRTFDIDQIAESHVVRSWKLRSLTLVLSALIASVYFAVFGFLASRFLPALINLQPFEGEELVRTQFLIGVTGLGAVLGAAWIVWEIAALLRKRRATSPMNRVSDAMLQVMARVAPLAKAPVTLTWPESDMLGPPGRATAQIPLKRGGQLVVKIDAQEWDRRITARYDQSKSPQGSLNIRWRREGRRAAWTRLSQDGRPDGSETNDVSQAMADALSAWLIEQDLGVLGAAVADDVRVAVRRDRFDPGTSLPTKAQAELTGRGVVAVPEVPKVRAHWLKRNGPSVIYLATAAVMIGGPILVGTVLAVLMIADDGFAASVAALGGFTDVLVAPIMLVPATLLAFRPPDLTIRRARAVRVERSTLTFERQRLSLGGTTIALDRKFSVHLSRDRAGDLDLVSVELRQGSATDSVRLGFSVPAEIEASGNQLPQLQSRWPLAQPRDVVGWIWPVIRAQSAAFGDPPPWSMTH